jgi:hypothetical protein
MNAVPRFIQTEDASYVRDTNSKALLNTNTKALNRHRILLLKSQETDELRTRVDQLEDTINNLTALMQQALAQFQHS